MNAPHPDSAFPTLARIDAIRAAQGHPGEDRRVASPDYREKVHRLACEYVERHGGDLERAAARAADHAAGLAARNPGNDSLPLRRDVASLLQRRADTLAGGRHA